MPSPPTFGSVTSRWVPPEAPAFSGLPGPPVTGREVGMAAGAEPPQPAVGVSGPRGRSGRRCRGGGVPGPARSPRGRSGAGADREGEPERSRPPEAPRGPPGHGATGASRRFLALPGRYPQGQREPPAQLPSAASEQLSGSAWAPPGPARAPPGAVRDAARTDWDQGMRWGSGTRVRSATPPPCPDISKFDVYCKLGAAPRGSAGIATAALICGTQGGRRCCGQQISSARARPGARPPTAAAPTSGDASQNPRHARPALTATRSLCAHKTSLAWANAWNSHSGLEEATN